MAKSLTDLPPNILLEILVRLPLKTLFASRCVCKTFLSLSSPNPHFIALHSSNPTRVLALQFGEDLEPSRLLCWIDPEIDVAAGSDQFFPLKPIFEIPKIWSGSMHLSHYRSSFRHENRLVIVNSCNGLLYFAKRRGGPGEDSLVCNPVTNEYVIVPGVNMTKTLLSETIVLMLGFSVGTNQYKVLRIFYDTSSEPLEMKAQVHVVGSGNSWRDIEDRPLGLDHSWDACLTYLNGVMYWLSCLEMFTTIISFDFEREMFGVITLPSEFGEDQLRDNLCVSIGVLGDYLCVTNNVYNHHLDIWVMKKHGEQESLIKEFVVDTVRPMGRRLYGQLRPLQVVGNGEILMHWKNCDLVCYDPRNKSLRHVGFGWLRLRPKIVGFTPSFVPLKDTLSVNKVMVQYVRPNSIHEIKSMIFN